MSRPLNQLKGGEKAEIAYLDLENNPDIHRLLSLGLMPGMRIHVLQRFPTYVVEANESQVAFDEIIAKAIFVN